MAIHCRSSHSTLSSARATSEAAKDILKRLRLRGIQSHPVVFGIKLPLMHVDLLFKAKAIRYRGDSKIGTFSRNPGDHHLTGNSAPCRVASGPG